MLDLDCDGVDDTTQTTALALFDTDGDGLLNGTDPDDDNDGLSDASEGSSDADSDGIINPSILISIVTMMGQRAK